MRMVNDVPAGISVPLLLDGGGVRLTNQFTVEIEGQERPACVAETMSIVYGT